MPDGAEEALSEVEAIGGLLDGHPGRSSGGRNNLVSPFVLGTSDSQNRTCRLDGRPGGDPISY